MVRITIRPDGDAYRTYVAADAKGIMPCGWHAAKSHVQLM